MGCRPAGDGVFCESISLTILLFLNADRSSSFGGAGRSCRSFPARVASRCVAMELVLPSSVDRGSGSSIRAGSHHRTGKSCLCLHLFPLHFGIRGWGSVDTPPERLDFRGCLQFFVARSSVLVRWYERGRCRTLRAAKDNSAVAENFAGTSSSARTASRI